MANAVSATTRIAAVAGLGAQPRERLHAVDARQLDVHQHQVGPVRARELDAVLGGRPRRACGSPHGRARRARASGCAGCPRRSGRAQAVMRSPRHSRVPPTNVTSCARSSAPFCARWLMRSPSRSRSARVISLCVSTTIGTSAVAGSARSISTTAKPSMSGISRSSSTTPGRRSRDELDALLAARRADHGEALGGEHRLHEREVERVVVDDDDRPSVRSPRRRSPPACGPVARSARATGIAKPNVLPSPSALSTHMRPPCSSTMRLDSVSPRPVPSVLVRAPGRRAGRPRRSRSCSSSAIPMPVSRTVDLRALARRARAKTWTEPPAS